MSALFRSPKTPEPPPIKPTVATPDVQAASMATRRRERAASGRAATMLTSSDEQSAAPMIGTKKLLGQ